RLRHGAASQEDDLVDIHVVVRCDSSAYHGSQLAEIRVLVPPYLRGDHDLLFLAGVNRERDDVAGPHRRNLFFDGQLDIGRMMVAAVDDDEVLTPTRDEQRITVDEAKIPRTQPTFVSVENRVEDFSRALVLCPIAGADV